MTVAANGPLADEVRAAAQVNIDAGDWVVIPDLDPFGHDVDVAVKFDPHQPRDDHGRWSRLPGSRITDAVESRQRDLGFLTAARKQFEKDRKVDWDTFHEHFGEAPLATSFAAFDVANTWPLPETVAAGNFENPAAYEVMQTAARNPAALIDMLHNKYHYRPAKQRKIVKVDGDTATIEDDHLDDAATEVARQVHWLNQAINDHGKDTPVGRKLWRVTGMDHIPLADRQKLYNGETLYMSEPGFLSTTTNQQFAEVIGGETVRGLDPVLWEIDNPTGVRAVNLHDVVDAVWPHRGERSDRDVSEWVFPTGTRFALRYKGEKREAPLNFTGLPPDIIEVTILPPGSPDEVPTGYHPAPREPGLSITDLGPGT